MPLFHDQVWVWRQAFARLEYLTGSAKESPIFDQPQTEPAAQIEAEAVETPAEPVIELEPVLNTTKTGQLTLF